MAVSNRTFRALEFSALLCSFLVAFYVCFVQRNTGKVEKKLVIIPTLLTKGKLTC
jgi:hypothetical protein